MDDNLTKRRFIRYCVKCIMLLLASLSLVFAGELESMLKLPASADYSFPEDWEAGTDCLKIPFPGAKKGATIRISNIDINRVSEYVELSEVVKEEENNLCLEGVILKAGRGLFGGQHELTEVYRISIPRDEVMEINRIEVDDKGLIAPDLHSIHMFAALNPDGSVGYLVNQSKEEYIGLKRAVSKAYMSNGFKGIVDNQLDTIMLDSGKMFVVEDTLITLSRKLTKYCRDIGVKLPPSFVCAGLQPAIDPGDEKKNYNAKILSKRFSIRVHSAMSVSELLKSACSVTGAYYEPTFWGCVIRAGVGRVENPAKFPPKHVLRVLQERKNILTVQDILNPGCIAVVSLADCYAGSAGESLEDVIFKSGNTTLLEALPGKKYLGKFRSGAFLWVLYKKFESYEPGGKFLENGSGSDMVIRNRIDERQLAASESYESFLGAIDEGLKIQMICPVCLGTGGEECNYFGRLTSKATLGYKIRNER